MECCKFIGTCPFLNKIMINLPIDTHELAGAYCFGAFTKCNLYKVAMVHGIDKVIEYIAPDGKYELSDRVIDLVLWGKVCW